MPEFGFRTLWIDGGEEVPKNISMLENDKLEIGKKRAEQLAKAFNVHPA